MVGISGLGARAYRRPQAEFGGGMTPERWQQVKTLLERALEREAKERAAFLDAACADDAELRREVESLLAYEERPEDRMAGLAGDVAARWLAEQEAASLVGRQIGPYQILREVGHGGMGEVYLAVRADDAYRKRVALKL